VTGSSVKVGIRFANADWRAMPAGAARFAELAEEHGIESVWAADRVVMPWHYRQAYPYDSAGRLPAYFHDVDIAAPLTWLAWIAARTSRIMLGTGILVLPQRPAVLVAKEAATLDVLSGGRLLLGVGAGWCAEEFAALGADFAGRHAALEEWIGALRSLWGGPHASYDGAHVRFDDVNASPRPTRASGVPVIIGGSGRAAAARAGRVGDGFYPARATPPELARLVAVLRDSARRAGRYPEAIEVTCGSEPDLDEITAYHRAGADRVVLAPPGRDPDSYARGLARIRSDVLEPLSRLGRPRRSLAADYRKEARSTI
jgi:probable F420-dependent oxidoreductase